MLSAEGSYKFSLQKLLVNLWQGNSFRFCLEKQAALVARSFVYVLVLRTRLKAPNLKLPKLSALQTGGSWPYNTWHVYKRLYKLLILTLILGIMHYPTRIRTRRASEAAARVPNEPQQRRAAQFSQLKAKTLTWQGQNWLKRQKAGSTHN